MAGCGEHRVDRLGVQPSGDDLAAQQRLRLRPGTGASMGSLLTRRLVHLGRGQDARGRRDRTAGEPSWIA